MTQYSGNGQPLAEQAGGLPAQRLRDALNAAPEFVRVRADDLRQALGDLSLKLAPLRTVAKGSVLVLTVDEPERLDPGHIDKALKEAVGHEDFSVIILTAGLTIETLPADAMAALGWFRKPF